MIDIRFYKRGWRIGFGPFFIRGNKQDGYSEYSIGRIKSSEFQQIGGMSWKEWRTAKATKK